MDVFTLAQVWYVIAAMAVIWWAIAHDPVFYDTLKRWITGDPRRLYCATVWTKSGKRLESDFRFRYQCMRYAEEMRGVAWGNVAYIGDEVQWLTVRDKRKIRYTKEDPEGIKEGNPGIVGEWKYRELTYRTAGEWMPVLCNRIVDYGSFVTRVCRPDEQNEWDKTIAESLFSDDFRRGTTV